MPEGELSWMDRNTPAEVLQIKTQTFAHKALKKNNNSSSKWKGDWGRPISSNSDSSLKPYLDKVTKSHSLTELWRSAQIQGDLWFREGKPCASDGRRSPALQNRLKTEHRNGNRAAVFI